MLAGQGLRMLSTASTARAALRQLRQLKPRLVLMDSALGDSDGLRLVDAIKKASPETRVVVMHLLRTSEDAMAYIEAGVSGFIMKDASATDFTRTIRAVADGRSVLPGELADSLFAQVAARTVGRGRRGVSAAMRMTPRERQVMNLIAQGHGNQAIGGELGIAAHTVKSHVHNLLEKLALRSRLEVAAFAHAHAASVRSGKRRLRRKPS